MTQLEGETVILKNRFRAWVFTLNNYSNEENEKLKQKLSIVCEKYIYQEEKGENGTKHLQGYIYFKNPLNFDSVKKKIDNNRIHLEKCLNIKASINYCSKKETRIGEIYSKNINIKNEDDTLSEIEDPLKNIEPYEWQKEILDLIKTKPDNRKIYVYIDKDGNKGKSSICKHICINYKRSIILGGKSSDMKYAVAQMIERKLNPKIILIDLSRTVENFVSYQGIEDIKNGCFFNNKFKSNQYIINSPHIIIFSNFELDYNAMSIDRWVIKHI